jgi:hypothetical protein
MRNASLAVVELQHVAVHLEKGAGNGQGGALVAVTNG